jgi:mono/diheme cytochrome c family protein
MGGAALLGFVFWTQPNGIDPSLLTTAEGTAARVGVARAGEAIMAATGCASCHSADGTDALAGGKAFETEFGTFYAPNISSHETFGIGAWSDKTFANAVLAGVTPNGAHYYPAFPYGSYNKMTAQDVVDLLAYLRTLPADSTPSRAHDLAFPFSIRRAVGVWKTLYVTQDWQMAGDLAPQLDRGRYLVEALGHCAECHTPRTALGSLDRGNWMRGAANPSGDGRIPSIHPGDLGWSAHDIAIYLDSGFTPEFDTVGGSMVDVVDNTAKLTDDDRNAIAAYLLALP